MYRETKVKVPGQTYSTSLLKIIDTLHSSLLPMKLSAWTLSATVATITITSTIVAAFTSPSNNLIVKRRMRTTSSTLHQQLSSLVGDEVRESKWHASPLTSFDTYSRVGSSPGHFVTHGTPTTSQQVSHHHGSLPPLASFDQDGRVGCSPGSFITHGTRSTAPGRTYVIIGDTVRESRASYAPMDHYGRVGTLGEVGTTEDDNSYTYIPASGYYIQPIVSSEFVPHSSTSSSYNTSSRNNIASGGGYSSTQVKKAGYGLGGWKK
jgi:hypothetical protein